MERERSQTPPGFQHSGDTVMPKSNVQAGWERLRAAWDTSTERVPAGAEPPDAPPEVKEWAQNTVVGVLVGIIYGGGRQYLADRAAGVPSAPAGLPSKAHAAKWVADVQTARLLAQMRAAVKGGAMVGGLFAVFHAVQLGSSIFHGQRSYRDTVAAGMATGAAFGAFVPGGPREKISSAILASALGSAAGFPVGMLQEHLVSLMPEDPRYPPGVGPNAPRQASSSFVTEGKAPLPGAPYQERSYDSAAALVARLEADLDRRKANRDSRS